MFLPPPTAPRSIGVGLIALLLVGCAMAGGPSAESLGPSSGPADRSERPARTEVPAQPVPSESTSPIVGEVPAALLEQILASAADHAGVDVEEIEVIRAESVTWNDGSLGCPEPGMMYTQALVPGYHVVLDAGDSELDYRAAATGDFRLCDGGGAPSGG
jgi:hypothetical protein